MGTGGHQPLPLLLACSCALAPAIAAAGDAVSTAACGDSVRALASAPHIAAKFALVREACLPHSVPPAPVPARPVVPAAQLYLYEDDAARPAPEPEAARPVAPAPSALPAAPATAPRKSVKAGGRAWQLAPTIDAAARRYDIDPLLLHAIAHVESRHNVLAVSHAGAKGVLQLMPATASRFGVQRSEDLHHAPTNVEAGAAYLKTLQRRFGNALPLVLAAYNAGEGAVEKYGRRIPPYRETQDYVRKVMAEYDRLRAFLRRPRTEAPARSDPAGVTR